MRKSRLRELRRTRILENNMYYFQSIYENSNRRVWESGNNPDNSRILTLNSSTTKLSAVGIFHSTAGIFAHAEAFSGGVVVENCRMPVFF